MSEKLINVFNKLEVELIDLKEQKLNFNQEVTFIIERIETSLYQIQEILNDHFFSSSEAEIDFFKNIYPKFFKLYYYYQVINNIEKEKNHQCIRKEREKEFYKNYLKNIKFFQKEELKMFRELRLYAVVSEKKLYLRKHYRFRRSNFIHSINDTYITNSISSSIGKREAYTDVVEFIETRMDTQSIKKIEYIPNLNWTDHKTDLIELIYAIYLKESLNNGKVELIRLIRFFEKHFNIALNNHHSTIQELKQRKKGKTKYFDQLRTLLSNKLEE